MGVSRELLSACILVLVSIAAAGQSGPGEMTGHVHGAQPKLIDGAIHPELIPDLTALRLFLLTVAEPLDATSEQRAREIACLKTARLSEHDIQSAIPVLASFKAQYTALVNDYNKTIQDVRGNAVQQMSIFLIQRDALITSTREVLNTAVSGIGMSILTAHVKAEKRNMRAVEAP